MPLVCEDDFRVVVTRKCIELDSERKMFVGWIGLSEWTFGEQVAAHAEDGSRGDSRRLTKKFDHG